MATISVIIPIYGVEKYLNKCIDSVLAQTYSDLEIILVDDGSPDKSPEICDKYAACDLRVKVVHKLNAGLGEARNTGLENASGDYIYFIDSDDWIEPDMLENMVHILETESADLVMCGFKRCSINSKPVSFCTVENKCVYKGSKVQTKVFLPMIAQKSTIAEDITINMCVWTNLYRRNIIEKYQIRFLSERQYLSEDICFNLQYLLHSQCVVQIPQMYYCYRYNPKSLTNRYKGQEYDMLVSLYQKVCQLADQTSEQEEMEYRKQRFFLTKLREVLFRLSNSSLPYKKKRMICKNILNDKTLRSVLAEYPISNYKLKYKIPTILMNLKNVSGVLAIFYITGHLRRR